MVGKAEPLIDAWQDLTPATLGIDWSRYIFLLAGLVAAAAGVGNFLWLWLQERHLPARAPSQNHVAGAGRCRDFHFALRRQAFLFYIG